MPRILISGATGLIGSALVASFESQRNEAIRLVRRSPQSSNELGWDPTREIPPQLVSGFDAIVHLSGEPVAGYWTETKKRRIRDSRVISTGHLSRALARAEAKPEVFICASAIGYYGNRGDETLMEDSLSGDGFFPEVCREWEAATEPAAEAGIRTVKLRTGIVLSARGGALKQMLLPFRLGLGGRVGDGRQWWSWIHKDDFVSAVQHIVRHGSEQTAIADGRAFLSSKPLEGPVNLTAPNPVTNAEFTRALAAALNRPAILPLPAFAAKLLFGEFAQAGLLSSTRVLPKKLLEIGFQFRYQELGTALADLVTRNA